MTPAQEPRAWVVVVAFEDAKRKRFMVVRHARRGWELPGGRLEAGESPIDAARREFEEETGFRLVGARAVLERDHGFGRGTVFEGRLGSRIQAYARTDHEDVREVRLVEHLGQVAPLSFPDDPYESIGHALGRPLLHRRPANDVTNDP